MKWSDDGLHLRLFFGNAAKIRFRKTSKFPYHKILVHSLLIPIDVQTNSNKNSRTRLNYSFRARKRCVVSFLPEEAVREARNTFHDVALLRP